MMLFQRRIFAELLRNTLTTLVLLTSIFALVLSAKILQTFDGLTLLTFVRSVPIFAATQLHLLVPLSVLVAIVITYSRAAADNEVDTLRASGVHPLHVMTPGLVFGSLMSFVLLWANDHAVPWTETAKSRLTNDVDIGALLRARLSAGEPVELDEHTIISVDRFDPEGHARGMRVLLYNTAGELEREIIADTAEMRINAEAAELEVTLRDLHAVKGPHIAGKELVIKRPLPHDPALLGEDELSTSQLMAWLRRGHAPVSGFKPRDAELAVDLRLASSATCVLFVLLGLPIALLFRRHDRTAAFLVAFLIALFFYYPAHQISLALTSKGQLSPLVASWAGNAFLVACGLLLCWRVFRR